MVDITKEELFPEINKPGSREFKDIDNKMRLCLVELNQQREKLDELNERRRNLLESNNNDKLNHCIGTIEETCENIYNILEEGIKHWEEKK